MPTTSDTEVLAEGGRRGSGPGSSTSERQAEPGRCLRHWGSPWSTLPALGPPPTSTQGPQPPFLSWAVTPRSGACPFKCGRGLSRTAHREAGTAPPCHWLSLGESGPPPPAAIGWGRGRGSRMQARWAVIKRRGKAGAGAV